jgi:hypothetical protein
MWLMQLLLTLTIAGLLTSIPCIGYAGGPAGRGGMGHAGGFRVPGTISVPPLLGVSSPFGVRSFVRSSLWGSSVVWVASPQVIVVPVFVQQQGQVPSEAPAPVPDPKFVSTPTQSAPSTSGPHTVIVQRGSKIEVQSFPVAR